MANKITLTKDDRNYTIFTFHDMNTRKSVSFKLVNHVVL